MVQSGMVLKESFSSNRAPSNLALNRILFPFFHYCWFRVDTKQAKILQITEHVPYGCSELRTPDLSQSLEEAVNK